MANNAEDMIIDGMHASDKISERMQYEIDMAEYKSKGEETEYMKYPKRTKGFDVRHPTDRRGWDEFTKELETLEKENPNWWDSRHGDPITYDSRGHKIGFSLTGKDMRPKGEIVSPPASRKENAMNLMFETDYQRANVDKSGYYPELQEYMRLENIDAAGRVSGNAK